MATAHLLAAHRWRIHSLAANLFRQNYDYDILVVGYPGQFDIFVARILSWLRGKALAWDILMSIYLITVERGLAQENPLVAQGLRAVEWCAVRLADAMFLDSDEYIRWFYRMYSVSPDRFHVLPTGADSDRFRPVAVLNGKMETSEQCAAGFHIVYHGTFLATHGVDTIIETARLLQTHREIRFTLMGDGPQREAAIALAKRYGLDNVAFTGWVDESDLQSTLASADVCIGAVGVTPQSYLSVQNKIYEDLAVAKPVITGDGPAVRQFFEHGVHLYLCTRTDPMALAAAIVRLQMDTRLRQSIAEQGHRLFRQQYTIEALGALYERRLRDLHALKTLVSMQLRHELTRNFVALFSSSVLERGILAVSVMIIARMVGPAGLGPYAAAFALTRILAVAFSLGLDSWLLRNGYREHDQERLTAHTTTCLSIKMSFGALWLVGMIALSQFLDQTAFPPLYILLCSLTIYFEEIANTVWSASRACTAEPAHTQAHHSGPDRDAGQHRTPGGNRR